MSTETPDAPPLAGLVVLDLTVARAGPTCSRHLSDWGADVIRVQPPDSGADDLLGARDGPDYQNLHRNKRVITLDLKSPEGHAAFLKLVARADVLVENMRVKVKHRLKIAWEDLKVINPRLVYGSISGFGQTGPYAERAGVDQIAQGMGGLMSITGEPGRGPMRVGIAISDVAAGSLLAFGIMTALFERHRTGVGRWVSTSLLESQVFMLDFQAVRYLTTGKTPEQSGNEHPTVVPTNAYPASDGHVNIAAISPGHWRILAEALGQPDWTARWPTPRGRLKDRAAVNEAISAVTATQSVAHWVEVLETAGIPCGPVYDIGQMFDDPQVKHLGIAADVPNPRGGVSRMLASPLTIEGAEKPIRSAAEPSGVHTDEVLAWLGYSVDEIEALRAAGVTAP